MLTNGALRIRKFAKTTNDGIFFEKMGTNHQLKFLALRSDIFENKDLLTLCYCLFENQIHMATLDLAIGSINLWNMK